MSETTPVRFGFNNRIPDTTLTSSPAPQTPLDYLKSELPSRRTVWDTTDTDGNIVISATLDEPQTSQFFALPDAWRIGDAEVKLELYLSPDVNLDRLEMPFTEFVKNMPADYIPLGDWEAGINAYGERLSGNRTLLPETFVYWFSKSVQWDSLKLTMRKASSSSVPLSNIDMRMLFLGNYYEMQTGMTFPHNIRYKTPPKRGRLSSGKAVSLGPQQNARVMTVPMPASTDQDKNALWELEQYLDDRAFIISAFPTETDPRKLNHYTMLGRLTDAIDHQTDYFNFHNTPITVEEA